MSSTPTFTAHNLHLWRGERHVLRGVAFTLQPGEVLHVSGPNGSGKTTLLRLVCGLLHAEEGQLLWKGVAVTDEDSDFAGALAYLGHDTALKGDLTALENLHFGVGLTRRVSKDELRAALADMGVEGCADLPCRVLSAGQKRRVALCRVRLSGAPLWVLDEPFTHLDAASSARTADALSAHIAQGGLAIVAAHQSLSLRSGSVARLELA